MDRGTKLDFVLLKTSGRSLIGSQVTNGSITGSSSFTATDRRSMHATPPLSTGCGTIPQRVRHGGKTFSSCFGEPNLPGILNEPLLPQIYGDGVDTLFSNTPPHATAHLTVTPTQFAHLQRWAAGDFTDNWLGPPQPPPLLSLEPAEQVVHLERAPLHDCMGGPFHPGIEMTWVMRLASVWKGPYRLNILSTNEPAKQNYGPVLTPAVCVDADGPFDGVAAGALTRFLGLPWQTDGVSCNSSDIYFPATFLSMPTFWGARYPDQVLSEANFERAAALDTSKSPDPAKVNLTAQMHKHFMLRVDWLRDLRGFDFYNRIRNSVDEWSDLGMVLPIPDSTAAPSCRHSIRAGPNLGSSRL